MTKKVFAASLIVASLIGATAAFALAPETTVEGIIRSVDFVGNTVTLADGMTLTAAPRLSLEPLQPGEFVRLMYHQGPDGRNELAAFWIDTGVRGES
jgi:hypothetical protein